MRKLIIGDIHGCNKTFNALLNKVQLSTADQLYLLGDYVDRGPDSKGVFDTIFKLKDEGYKISCLRGNHEEMMLEAFDDYTLVQQWNRNGGKATLQSFRVQSVENIPSKYLDFCTDLPYFIETEDLILVHAGLNFKKKNPLTDTDNMIWIRDWYDSINFEWLENRTIIHGHTPLSRTKIESIFDWRKRNKVINLDCGAIFTKSGYPDCYLCCLDWTNEQLYFQETLD